MENKLVISLRVWSASTLVGILQCEPLAAQVTQRVNLSSRGVQADALVFGIGLSITPDGRYVSFSNPASNLVPEDTNGYSDVFVRDRGSGVTERVSVGSGGIQGNGASLGGFVSADGRFVGFTSYASNLVAGDTNGDADAFIHDRIAGTTERVSLGPSGIQGNDYSGGGPITPDGRYVVMASKATNFVPNSPQGIYQVFVRDRQSSTIEIVSITIGGFPPSAYSYGGSISDDGRFIAFVSEASNLVAGDTNGSADVFVRDRQNAMTERVSVDSSGTQAEPSFGTDVDVSLTADGRYVAFSSSASNLAPGDTNGKSDIFIHDRQTDATERVSVNSGGTQANGDCYLPWVSQNGRYVVFASVASNLVLGDTNASWDVFIRDRLDGTTERISVGSSGSEGNSHSGDSNLHASIDGRYVVFNSWANNIVPGDTNARNDVFVRDRLGGTSFASLCDPGVSGTIACPCGNPRSSTGQGCDNSSGTGGAVLSASGGTFLSSDSLVFATSDQRPSGLCIVTQWTGANPGGAIFGQGVRCTSGTLKRLYTKSALGGSITAPDFGAGDPQVSVRSAALGDTIIAGQSRWYLVYYRDPIVLGGCPPTSTFNCTQTGQVTWTP